MPKHTGRVGGFTAQNSGKIENCYSVVRLGAKGYLAGGFSGDNTGNISKSWYYCRIKGLLGGFTGKSGGNTEESCYFFHEEKEGSKQLKKLCDPVLGQRLKEIDQERDVQRLGFDTESVWQYQGGKAPLRFIPDQWLFDIRETPKILEYVKTVTRTGQDETAAVTEDTYIEARIIHNADELQKLAEEINSGDQKASASLVRLDADIDLGGKAWIPIGKDRTCAFTGLFDGCGHVIKNFIIKDKKIENKGLFGFIKGGEIYNLSVDCNLKGGTCAGGIAAQNDGGTIGCCSATIEIKGKDGTFGGLVGHNTGTIFESYTAGRIIALIIPWWWGLPILGLLLLMAVAIPNLPGVLPSLLPTFAPVPYDQDQIPIPDDTVQPNTDGNFVSFQFEQEIEVSLSTGLCKFGFRNPGNSNHNIVVQLQFTDAQAIRVMGSTGRTADEQRKLEENASYNPETYRTVIAESGAIRPSYQLEDLRLVAQPNGATLPPGSYNAMVYLVFYDINTNERAMLESQLPVIINAS